MPRAAASLMLVLSAKIINSLALKQLNTVLFKQRKSIAPHKVCKEVHLPAGSCHISESSTGNGEGPWERPLISVHPTYDSSFVDVCAAVMGFTLC